MPRDKDLKRIIRQRMEKTGEAYTTARAHIIDRPAHTPGDTPTGTAAAASSAAAAESPTAAESPAAAAGSSAAAAESSPPAAGAAEYAAVAGMADETVQAKTGRDWREWVEELDGRGAAEMAHRDIARIVHEELDVPNWWAQTVTVGYERIKGLRARGQRRSGSWEASRSRTFPVPVDALFDCWLDAGTRRQWLSDADPVVRTANRPKTARLEWHDGTRVELYFTAKGDARSSVVVQHTKLPDRAAVDDVKQYWGTRLDALAALLRDSA